MISNSLRVRSCFVFLCCAAYSSGVIAQVSPEESLKSLHPADGLEVSLWASEPMVRNPTAIEVDSRGRVWIAEGLNYRMKQKEFDSMGRIEGADQIKVLSDTDGDGKADKVTVFADNIFPVPLGLAVEEIWQDGKQTGTRVYSGNSPDLLVLEDTDGDDRADHRYALLTGFNGVDSDHGLHGMTFGPDGKLYFTVGDARYGADKVQAREPTFDVTDKSGRRVTSSNFGTTLRCNRDGTELEVLSSGHRNNYEAAVDSFGNVFGSDNDDDGNRGCRMYWVMDGGEYGYQHPDSSRHWAEELPGIIPKLVGTGNGAPGGLVVYEGGSLPSEYHGAVLQIDSGTHQVNSHPLVRHGAGFRSEYNVLLKGEDAWFRPVDLSVAPDGSLFVCDWYDAGVGGNRFSDQTTGRIYRLSAKSGASNTTRFNGTNVVESLQSPNQVTRLAASDSLLAMRENARQGLLEQFASSQPSLRARALHLLHDLPGTGVADTIAALQDSDPRIRETAVTLLDIEQTISLATDEDAGVRRALLMNLRNVVTPEAETAIATMAGSWDGRDRYYLEALRAAMTDRDADFVRRLFDTLATSAIKTGWNDEPIAVPPFYPIGTNDAFLRISDQLPPSNAAARVIGLAWALQRAECLPAVRLILAQNQSPSVERAAIMTLAGISDSEAGRILIQRFADVDETRKSDILARLGAGVAGPWSSLAKDDELHQLFTSALDDPTFQQDAIHAIARAKLDGFNEQLIQVAKREANKDTARAAAITALGKLRHPAVNKLATEIVKHAKDQTGGGPIALAALASIQSINGNATPPILVAVLTDSAYPLDVQRRALQLTTASSTGVDRVLSLRKEGTFPAGLESELSFLLHNHADRQIRRIAAKELPIKSEGGGKQLHAVQDVLALQGDAARGRELFQNHKDAACARCHRVTGEGTLVGPDLASIGTKYGDKELLYHIQFPSGAINYNFVAHTFLLDDGRILTGLVVDRADGQIKLGLSNGEFKTINSDEVDEEYPQTVSLMPEGLVANFTTQELSDLIEYLLTLRQGDAVKGKPISSHGGSDRN